MKFALYFLLFIIPFLFSFTTNDTHKESSNNTQFSKQLRQRIKTPAALQKTQQAQTITVLFSVDENGQVNEVFAKTQDTRVKSDLEQQFRQMTLKGLAPAVMNSIDINFLVY